MYKGSDSITVVFKNNNVAPTFQNYCNTNNYKEECELNFPANDATHEVLKGGENSIQEIYSDAENVKRFECDLCQAACTTSQLLKKHKLKCHGEGLICEFCKKVYMSRYHLKQHLNKVHPSNALDLKCHLCDYRTHNRFNLKGHIDRHNKAASFICDECGKGFYSRSTLKEHKRGKHGSGFPCELCGAVLTSMSNLRQHRKTHEPKSAGVKYQCDICGQGYRARSKCAFRLHVLKHQGIVKQFKCSDCNKILTSDNSYRQHLRKHSGEKPFICEFCSKAFAEKKYLQVHRRIHTGEKPYECDICGVCFNQRSTMTSHRRSHKNI